MKIYSIKPIKNGYVVRCEEECVVETYYKTELEALDALSSHIINRKIAIRSEEKVVQ